MPALVHVWHSLLLSVVAAAPAPTVELGGHRARFTSDAGASRLVLDLEVLNRHAVGVRRIEVGLLAATSDEALEQTRELGQTYLAPTASKDGVTALRGVIEATLAAGESRRATLAFDWPVGAPEPSAFVTHVLGYELVEPPLGLVLAMLATERPADERAALAVFGLLGDAADQLEARGRMAGDTRFVDGLVALARRAPAEAPTQQEVLEWAFVVLALGVVGGPEAHGALEQVGAAESSERLTEAYQVLRAARLTGNRLETPLAFALPVEARSLRALATMIAAASPRLPELALQALAERQAQPQVTQGGEDPDLRARRAADEVHAAAEFPGFAWALLGGAVLTSLVAVWVALRRKEARRG